MDLQSQKRQAIFEKLTRRARRMARKKPTQMLVCEAEALKQCSANIKTQCLISQAKRDARALFVPDPRYFDVDSCRDTFRACGDLPVEFDRPQKRTAFQVVKSNPETRISNLQSHALGPTILAACDNRVNGAHEFSARHTPSIPSLAELLKLYPCILPNQQPAATIPPTAASHITGAGGADIATLLLLTRIAASMPSAPPEPAAIAASIAAAAMWTNAAAASSALPTAGRPDGWRSAPAAFAAPPPPLAATAAAPKRYWAAAPGFDAAAAAAAAVALLEAAGGRL